MSDFSIIRAASAGLNVARRRPVALLFWYLVSVAIGFLGLYLAGRLIGPAVTEMIAVQAAGGPPDPQVALAAAGKMLTGAFLLVPLYLVLGAITTTAANRAVLHPDDSAFGYLRLGPDELRMIVVLLVIGLITFAAYFVGAIVAVLIATLAGGAAGGAANAQRTAQFVSLALLPVLVLLGLLILKFCAAPAQTLDTRAINIFGSWSLTKGRFGPVFLTYLINFIVFVVLYLVLLYLSFYAASAISGQPIAQVMRPDPAAAFNVTSPPTIVRVLISGVIAVLGQLLLVCPGADVYQQLAGRTEEEAF
jgi:hypothetical protein